MSDPSKAVFLSYASQDAEAAKRICEALRAAGIEVWFDQNELRGGDAWDQKIRRQIKECALFVPIISPNTNARPEGYFRLEWKLAVDRSHLLADDHPFLFPIALDGVTDATARVPEKFKDVQWTHLRLDETPGELATRISRLLAPHAATATHTASPAVPPAARAAASRWQWWMIFPIVGTLVGLGFAVLPLYRAYQRPERAARPSESLRTPAAAPSGSEARTLADRAFAMSVDKYDSTLDDYTTAEALMKRAVALDGEDGEILARSAQLQFMFRNRGFDFAPERIALGRTQAERAVRLAPDSVEGQLALSLAHRYTGNTAAMMPPLQRAVELQPNHARALIWLGSRLIEEGKSAEGRALFVRARRNSEWAPLIDYYEYLNHFATRQFAEAEKDIRSSFNAIPSINSAAGILRLHLTWTGDLDAAVRELSAVPPAMLNSPRLVWMTAEIHLHRRAPDDALRVLDRLPDEFIRDSWFTGPKALLVGRAHALAGRTQAARLAWESALRFVDEKLKTDASEAAIHRARGELLAALGRADDALAEAKTFEELARGGARGWNVSAVTIYATLGRPDLAVPKLAAALKRPEDAWPLTPTLLRQDPRWDPIRNDPDFQKLVEENRAAPTPTADEQATPPTDKSAALDKSTPAEKSVAVLAFANLSEDKANEYFSDGISEELLNVLAKVPGLKVSARTSAFFFKGKDVPIPEIAQKLGVAYVVEGSVRKAGEKVRITAQLIKATDGFHVWSDTFTRDLKNVFAVQDEIAGLIAQNLQLRLDRATGDRAGIDPEAHRLYLEGRFLLNQFTLPGARAAAEKFKSALQRSERFAAAWVALAEAEIYVGGYSENPNQCVAGFEEARRATARALEIDPRSATAYVTLASVLTQRDFDWAGANAAVRRARELEPNSVEVLRSSMLNAQTNADFPAALAFGRQALQQDPLNLPLRIYYGLTLRALDRPEEAVAEFRAVAALSPGAAWSRAGIALVRVQQGQIEEAIREAAAEPTEWARLYAQTVAFARAKRTAESDAALHTLVDKFGNVAAYQVAEACSMRGEPDRAFEWLERAYRQRDPGLSFLLGDPELRPLHDDPRWLAFTRRLNFPTPHAP